MKKLLCITAIALGLASPMLAGLSKQYSNWAEGPVQWLMTDQEMATWKTIDTDQEAQHFIDLFWARRDPTPATPANEMKQGFEERAKTADEHFTVKRTPGSLTERGRVFLLLGAPYRIGRTSNAPQSTQQSGAVGSIFEGAAPTARGRQAPGEIWFYEKDHRPPFEKDLDFSVKFIDEYGTNEYKMIVAGDTIGINDLLERARQYYIAQPNLTEVPDFTKPMASVPAPAPTPAPVPTEFQNQALKAALDAFRADGGKSATPLDLTWDEFVTPEGQLYVPLQLYVPASANVDPSTEVTFFGAIQDKDGKIVRVYEQPATLTAAKTGGAWCEHFAHAGVRRLHRCLRSGSGWSADRDGQHRSEGRAGDR